MKLIKSLRWVIVVGFALMLSSCASTYVTGSWKDANYTRPVQKVMVIGLGENKGRRRLFEDTLAAAFIKDGKQAVPSANYFDDIREISKETVLPIVKENNIDAVIVARMISVDKEQRFVPSAYPAHYNSFYGYYGRVGGNYYDPGYYVEDTLVSLEINLYETANAKLIWAITTETFSPENINKEINKLSSLIMSNLRKEGLL